ncbi:Serine/threonine-protein kinase [Coniosporium apollinis]|uniref:Serine/threonine-protein kinase n=2 Tax=Coniosporium TaxID=2810619 RepID=A0ABQ9NTA5_9PEZI|nr:Serine/threonine-protein kinase [Cladosporium sp. JES 115]KAJ9664938.1 Serine/threonine-protein kinase [Coniosporium apollinis]
MASANNVATLHRATGDDDGHEQLASGSSTPPGAATPRPDLTDKRLPGILHTYFGQVCDSFRTRPKHTSSTSPTHIAASGTAEQKAEHRSLPRLGGDALPTAPASPTEAFSGDGGLPPLLPHEQPDMSHQKIFFRPGPPSSYPTPPTSAASSMHRTSKDEPSTNGCSDSNAPASRTRLSHNGKAMSKSPSKARRHTFAISSPLSSIITTSSVPAAHIANPATRISTTSPSSPIVASLTASRPPSPSKAAKKVKRLTEGGISLSAQNTPPQTPRTRSQEDRVESPKPQSSSSGTSRASDNAAVAPPKGKLSVIISEGRALQPSVDPYCVCQFQWAEYISDGPRKGRTSGKTDGAGKGDGVVMRRADSEMGRPMAIPMRSRQSSHSGSNTGMQETRAEVTNPKWDHEAIFDVVGDHSEIDVSVYDRANQEAFLGHVRFCPSLVEYESAYDGWFPLEPREGEADTVTGEIHLRINFQKTEKKHYGPEDFQILKLIGKGTFGQVFQVRKKDTGRIYAMKVLSKKVIVQKKEVAHTLGERNILVRTATADSAFIVGLKFSFQTPTDLYLVTDYMSGGELFWHLQKEGRFHEARAKFYIAELILALQHLHEHDIVYRDLKPENILLDANGHIALCDFGLSKANLTDTDTTNTFCGTTEYLAPEVLLDEHGYTKMVDFWSLGVLVFEMCCGWSPFYAEDTQQMYKNIAFGKVRFPRDALSTEGRNFVKGLLNRNPKHRLGAIGDAEELKAHPFFADIDWDALGKKNLVPPFKPKLKSELDVSNFDPEFTNALNNTNASSLNARAAALASGVNPASTPLSPTMQANFKGFTFVDESNIEKQFRERENDMERMEEDDKGDDEWHLNKPYASQDREDRMSGIERVHTKGEEDIFNHQGFDA